LVTGLNSNSVSQHFECSFLFCSFACDMLLVLTSRYLFGPDTFLTEAI